MVTGSPGRSGEGEAKNVTTISTTIAESVAARCMQGFPLLALPLGVASIALAVVAPGPVTGCPVAALERSSPVRKFGPTRCARAYYPPVHSVYCTGSRAAAQTAG